MIFVILILIMLIAFMLTIYSAMIVASDADNREEELMRYEQSCDNCRYSKPDWTNKDNTSCYCENEDSDFFGLNTDYVDECEEWTERR